MAPQRVGAPERQLLLAAARRIAAQTALTVVLLLAVVGAVVFWLDQQAGREDVQDVLSEAVAAAGTGRPPPVHVVVVTRSADGRVQASAGSPAAIGSGRTLAQPVGTSEYTGPNGSSYTVLTADRPGGQRVQALYDIADFDKERTRLVTALLLADGLGALGAAGVAWLVASRAIRPLSDALAIQRQFVADASHELRTPLTLLHTRAQLLERSTTPATPAGERELVEAMVRDTRELGDIVGDLLTSAELAHHPAARERVDLSDLVSDVVVSFRPAAEAAGLELRTELPGPVRVSGARAALRRALSALLDNAMAHSSTGDCITVGVRGGDGRGRAALSVADTGTGLDPTHADELFTRFARAGDAPRHGYGHGRRFGLGLALVRDVVSAHGGQVLVDGAPGQGATFTILLPAEQD